MQQLSSFKTWRNLFLEFKNSKFEFSVEILMNGNVQPLFPFEKLRYLLDNYKSFEIDPKAVDLINFKIANFKKISEELPMNTISEKIDKIKSLFKNGIQIESLDQPLQNLRNQIIFIKRAYNCMDHFQIAFGKEDEIDRLSYVHEDDRGKTGKAIVDDLLTQTIFRDTQEYQTINVISI